MRTGLLQTPKTYRQRHSLGLIGRCNSLLIVVSVVFGSLVACEPATGQTTFREILSVARKDAAAALKAAEKFTKNVDAKSGNLEHARTLEFLARYYFKSHKSRLANERLQRAQTIAEKYDDRMLLARIWQLYSALYETSGRYKEGVEAADRALGFLAENEPYRAVCLNERGSNLASLKRFDEATADFRRALELAQQAKNERLAVMVRVNLANVFGLLKQFDESLKINQEAIKEARNLKDDYLISSILVQLGNDEISLAGSAEKLSAEKRTLVQKYYNEALQIAGKHQYLLTAAIALSGLGDLAAIEHDHKQARYYFQRALQTYQQVGDLPGILQTSTRLTALINAPRPEVAQVDIDQLRLNLQNARNSGDTPGAILIVDELVDAYRKLDQQDELISMLTLKIDLMTDLFNETAERAVQEGSTAIAVAQKQHELDRSKEQALYNQMKLANRNRQVFIVQSVAIGSLLAAGVFLFLWRRNTVLSKRLRQTNATLRQEEQKTLLMERHLAQQEKLESLSTMSAGVMHDFNNYLSAIVADAEVGINAGQPELKDRQFETVIDTALCAADLTKGLSDYLGSGELRFHVFSGSELVQQLDTLIHSLVDDRIDLQIDHSIDTLPVFGDINAIRNVIINIVKNSVEACRDQKSPRIFVKLSPIEVNGTDCLEILVEDDGPGIPAPLLKRITEPFFSTKGTGRGLGLASSKGIIESHDGKMEIASTPGQGTRVKILIPIEQPKVGSPEADVISSIEMSSMESQDESRNRILYVDDDELVRRAMHSLLGNHYLTQTADSAEAAMAMIDGPDQKFDCVITDFDLTNANGLDLAQYVKSVWPNCKVILVSGYVERRFTTAEEIDLFLSKPFTHSMLLSSLNQLVQTQSHLVSKSG